MMSGTQTEDQDYHLSCFAVLMLIKGSVATVLKNIFQAEWQADREPIW
jgi:hypothetical protein